MSSINKNYVGALALFIWSTHAASGKFILQDGNSPWVLTAIRLWIAFIAVRAVMGLLPEQTRNPVKQDRNFWISFLVGFLPNILFFHYALAYGFAGSTMILENTAPFFVLIGAVFVFKNRLSLQKVFSVFLATLGIMFVFAQDLNLLENGLLGCSFGLLAGMTWAVFSFYSERIFKESQANLLERMEYLSRFMLYGAILVTPSLFIEPINYSSEEWMTVLYYAIAPTAIAYVLWNELVSSISALSATIIFSLTVPLTLLFAWLTLGEVPTSVGLASALLIMVAVVLDALGSQSKKTVFRRKASAKF